MAATYDWNPAEAERQFRKSIELNPSCAHCRGWYALYSLAPAGRYEEARQQANVNVSRQEVALLGEHEIRSLPGPKHVALVHIQDGTVNESKPFLVDLTNNEANLPK